MIYFDNAATSGKKPIEVVNAVDYALKNLSANPGRSGHKLSQLAAEKVYNSRKKVAEYFGCDDAENVVFTANCTQSINYVLKGVLERGDHIVVSDLEHNAVMRPLKSMGIQYSTAEVSLTDDEITLKNFKSAIRQNTKMIFCTLASNVLGKILPIQQIGELCKSKSILFGVDAAQGAGILNIDMNKMNIDFLCVAPHKGLYAPMGIGILIANKPIRNTIIEGGTGTNSLDYSQPDIMPERFESGTLNLPGIVAVFYGIDFVNKKGRCIYDYEMKLVDRLYNGLSVNKKAILYTKPTRHKYAPVLPFNIIGKSSDETADFLNKNGFALRAGLHCAPSAHRKIKTEEIGAVRFSPSVFNFEWEVDKLLRVLA